MAGSKAAACKHIQSVQDLVSADGELVTAIKDITSNVVGEVDAVLGILQGIDNELIKHTCELMTALHEVQGVVQLANEFLAKVEDFFHFSMESKTMRAATAGLNRSPPDTKHLCDLIGLLKKNLAEDRKKCEEFENACEQVIKTCKRAAEMCARKEKECQYQKIRMPVAFLLGGTAVGVYAAWKYNVIAKELVGVMIFVGICICVYLIAGVPKRGYSFHIMRGKFDTTLQFAHQAKRKVEEVYGTLKRCSDHIGYIDYSVLKDNPVMMRDTLERFKDVCTSSCTIISQCKHTVEGKLKEFKHRQAACSA